MMNEEQIKAVKSLQRALNKCHKAELQGMVLDYDFCIWPEADTDYVMETCLTSPQEFLERVDEKGEQIFSLMTLGAGGT